MFTVGERLKAERERLGLSQTALGEMCGVQKRTQINYEKGDRSPDALYLAAFHAAGGDVMWVVIGDRTAPALLPPEESVLLDHYRASPPELRRAALRVLLGGDEAAPAKSRQVRQQFNGPVGQAAEGDIVNQGDFHVGTTTHPGVQRKRGPGGSG